MHSQNFVFFKMCKMEGGGGYSPLAPLDPPLVNYIPVIIQDQGQVANIRL